MRKSVLLLSAVLFLLFSLVSPMGCKQRPTSAPTQVTPVPFTTPTPAPKPSVTENATPTPEPTLAPEPPQTPLPTPAVERLSPFGIHVDGHLAAPHIPGAELSWMIGEMRELGAVWLRLNVMWANVEKTEGQYDWSYFDTVVHRTREAGIELLINVRGYSGAGWPNYVRELYVADSKEKLPAYERFLRELVRRYKEQIRYWQIENEVESQDWWRGTMDEYVLVLGAAYRTIKSEDPTSQVLIAGFPTAPFFIADVSNPLKPVSDQAWVQRYFERVQFVLDRGSQYFDILDLHLYGKPERMTERIDFFRQQMSAFGYQKPIWLTETGGPDMRELLSLDSAKWEQLPPGDTDSQAREVPKRFTLALAAGIDRIFWHSLTQQDIPIQNLWSGMALVLGKQRRPAFYTYQLMVRKLEGFKTVEQLDFKEGVWAYRFSKPSGDVYVLWADNETVVKLPIGAERVTVTSVTGASLEAKSESLSVTNSPVFVEAMK